MEAMGLFKVGSLVNLHNERDWSSFVRRRKSKAGVWRTCIEAFANKDDEAATAPQKSTDQSKHRKEASSNCYSAKFKAHRHCIEPKTSRTLLGG